MRYYKIIIDGGPTFTSLLPDGRTDMSALLVEMDIDVAASDVPMSGSFVRVWGIGVDLINQAHNLHGKPIKVFGGMAKGLPLAKPEQAGLLTQGYIWKSFGNWIGTDMSLDLVIGASPPPKGVGPNPAEAPQKNLVLNWTKGTKLSDALETTLKTGYPEFGSPTVNISPKLVATQDNVGYFQTLEELGHYARRISQSIIPQNSYPGVGIVQFANKITVDDGTMPPSAKLLAFEDLIGQPTWILPTAIQVQTVMRADLHVNDVIQLPPTRVISTPAAVTGLNQQNLTFQGSFVIMSVRHVGNSRQPDASSWVSIFNAYTSN